MSARELFATLKQGLAELPLHEQQAFFRDIHALENSQETSREMISKQEALARFALGVEVTLPSTEEELGDARFEYLRNKHLK